MNEKYTLTKRDYWELKDNLESITASLGVIAESLRDIKDGITVTAIIEDGSPVIATPYTSVGKKEGKRGK